MIWVVPLSCAYACEAASKASTTNSVFFMTPLARTLVALIRWPLRWRDPSRTAQRSQQARELRTRGGREEIVRESGLGGAKNLDDRATVGQRQPGIPGVVILVGHYFPQSLV